MPKECSICSNRNRQAIEALIRNKIPLRKVAAEYRVGFTALSRHKRHMSNSDPLALPDKKRRYVEARLKGKSKRQAVVAAGYAPGSATAGKKLEAQPDVRAAFSALIRETVPAERIAKAIAEGIEAKETKFFAHEGMVTDQRDVVAWSERRQYTQLAAEYGGYHAPDKGDREQGGGVILILPDSPRPAPIIEARVVDVPSEVNGPMLILPDTPKGEAGA
jgi:hypothetical protein